MAVVISLAETQDVARMREIEVDAGSRFRDVGLHTIADDAPPSIELLAAHIETATAWLARQDGIVVGYATASVVDGEAHLDQVSVTVAAAGHGIGRQLLDAVAEWGCRARLPSLTLTTFRDVPWNGPYYARLGFTAVADAEMGDELRAIRQAERDASLDVAPRVAMRKRLG